MLSSSWAAYAAVRLLTMTATCCFVPKTVGHACHKTVYITLSALVSKSLLCRNWYWKRLRVKEVSYKYDTLPPNFRYWSFCYTVSATRNWCNCIVALMFNPPDVRQMSPATTIAEIFKTKYVTFLNNFSSILTFKSMYQINIPKRSPWAILGQKNTANITKICCPLQF